MTNYGGVVVDQLKEQFISIVKKNISRCGIDDLLTYLDSTDFYVAPASTKYHGAYECGLLEHSINVYFAMVDFMSSILYRDSSWQETNLPLLESVTIVSLFHDLCKIGKYEKSVRNVKDNATGIWHQEDCYTYNKNQFRLGHSAASLHIISKFLMLKDEEAQAIYWHMGGFDISNYSSVNDLGVAFNENQLAFCLHMADMIATYIDENDKIQNSSVSEPMDDLMDC